MPADLPREEVEQLDDEYQHTGWVSLSDAVRLLQHALAEPARIASTRQGDIGRVLQTRSGPPASRHGGTMVTTRTAEAWMLAPGIRSLSASRRLRPSPRPETFGDLRYAHALLYERPR